MENETTYTQAQYDELQAQIKELEKFKPIEPTPEQAKIKELEKQIFDAKVDALLQAQGLSDFKGVIVAKDEESLNQTIATIKEIMAKQKLSNTYVPSDTQPTDAYDTAVKNKDTLGMIGNKLKNLF